MKKNVIFTLVISLFFALRFLPEASGELKKSVSLERDSEDSVSRILTQGDKLYSQFDEELIIRDFFNDRKGGIFLDVGSAHYKDMSTTYYLERHLNWSGIAVDALAVYAIGYIENRPQTRFFSFLVTDSSGTVEKFYRLLNAAGLSSADKEYMLHLAEYFNAGTDHQVIDMPTITLNDLLKTNGIEKIDFISMDIEGGELKALRGFDIEKYSPELVCIEVAKKNRAQVKKFFRDNGYELIDKYLKYDSINWYLKKSEIEEKEEFVNTQ